MNPVNCGDKDLSKCGTLPQFFIKVVGEELNDKYDGVPEKGQVKAAGVTSNLQCKTLLHVRIDKWQGQQQSKEVRQKMLI